ncbi:acetyl-CoA synthetase-like protein [Aureobasidium sp. EXF-10727]|nr:acetyl-CoA synthetase-like protein [Aureobasidium sp. EXF-10727]KAI4726164.1 acetyl-CoA synthetase-like protein [Aureobasidium sp. EXF-10728]
MTDVLPISSRSATLDSKYSSIRVSEARTQQVLTTKTTTPSTVDELIKLRASQEGKNDPIIAYPEHDTAYTNYTPYQLDRFVERAASFYTTTIPQRRTSDDPVQIIGLLGPSDFSYLVAFLAISRLGHSVLLLSTRITAEAHESLLSTTKATGLIYNEAFWSTATALSAQKPDLRIMEICDTKSLPTASANLKPAKLDSSRETLNISFIIHSSGSTGLPKPIFQTHKASLYAYSQHFNRVGHITLPLYHNHGICCLFRAIWASRKIYIYNARLPLTSQHLLATLKEHRDIRILYAVPYALKLLSETEEGQELLSNLDIVMFGGSACPKPIGDRLVESGVNLVGHYGATELGQLMTSFRDHKEDKGWDWLRVGPHLEPYLRMENRGPNLFELCVMEGWPSKVATNRDDGSYATKDLFEPHPTIPNAWRYYARLDDTLVLENGEKANPLIAEGVIRQSEHVAEAIVFGANKPRLGAFVVPSATSTLGNEDLLDAVMAHVDEANKVAPSFAYLSREMIKVLPSDVDFRKTDKGTVIRAAFYRDFAEQIDAAYLDEQSGTLVLPKDQLLQYLREEFAQRITLKQDECLNNDTDLFSLGVDSLQAIQARSNIIKTLDVQAKDIGRNFVFDFPTLSEMANEILRLQNGGPKEQKLDIEERMAAMVEKYAHFEQHQPVQRPADGAYIVVTGATGSLGAHAVAIMAAQSTTRKVYCLVRAKSSADAERRVWQSLRERQLFHTLSATARSKIIAYPSNFAEEQLGLDAQQYEAISRDITHLLHLAWSVNFNKSIESFEADCIRGVRNLTRLCLHAKRPEPASFNFCSSVSATVRTPGDTVPEAIAESFAYAQGMGYAQSKSVAESLCDRAAKQTNMKCRVLRVGQIIGDTRHGVWNETEAIPLIFQSAKSTGTLPSLDENPTWLPVDLVANACTEIALSNADSGVMNIVNSKSFHWTRDLLPLLHEAGLSFDVVDQREWIKRLRASNPDPVANPSIKLVDFFASKYDNDNTRKSLAFASDVARSHSPSLANAGVIDVDIIQKIVNYLETRYTLQLKSTSLGTAYVIGGPCGTGKSSLAGRLSKTLSLPIIEGDELHSIAARAQMSNKIPLGDTERMDWLAHLRGAAMYSLATFKTSGVLVTCSALKATYRDELRKLNELAGIKTIFLLLTTNDKDAIKDRMSKREGHYMAPCMVDAQMAVFEDVQDHEVDCVQLDAMQDLEHNVAQALCMVDML